MLRELLFSQLQVVVSALRIAYGVDALDDRILTLNVAKQPRTKA